LSFRVNYLEERKDILTGRELFTGGGTVYMLIYDPVRHWGWSIETAASIIEKEKLNWKLQAVINNEKYEYRDDLPATVPAATESIAFSAEKPQWKGSVKTDLQAGHFFLQASALLSFNDFRYATPSLREYFDNHGVNFLVAGYGFSFDRAFIKQLQLSLQVRNAVLQESSTANAYRYRYMGLGLKAEF
jgi:hypothetical protein